MTDRRFATPNARSDALTEQEGSAALAASFAFCRDTTKARARNFYHGLKLTPEPKRSAMYAVYAWMRAADDLADEPGEAARKADALQRFRELTHALIREADPAAARQHIAARDGSDSPFAPMWPAVHDTLHRYAIRGADLDDMIAGQLLDQQRSRYESFAELRDYCYKVASTVGLVCISVWGCDDMDRARELAVKRGLAFQLTNILRDLAEDARRDRIYLPVDEIERFGYSERDLLALLPSPAFDALLGHQLDRARRLYAESAPLDGLIHAECRPTSWALNCIYSRLLERIAADPRRVLTERVRLSRFSKLAIALRASRRARHP